MSPSDSSDQPDSTKNVGLVEIFSLQDQAFEHRFLKSLDVGVLTTALSRLVVLGCQAMNKMNSPAEKQTVVRLFAGDVMSQITVPVRIGLWGALPESLSDLPGGIESCAQLAYIVNARKYGTAFYEAQKFGRLLKIVDSLPTPSDRQSMKGTHEG